MSMHWIIYIFLDSKNVHIKRDFTQIFFSYSPMARQALVKKLVIVNFYSQGLRRYTVIDYFFAKLSPYDHS